MDVALELRDQITGFMLSQAIAVAARLGVADFVEEKGSPIEALAKRCHADSALLYRLLRALASKGIFEETAPEVFRLTPKAALLRSDAPGSLRHYAIMYGEEAYSNFAGLHGAVVTGEVPFPKTYGKPFFDYLQDHPDSAETFRRAMVDVAQAQATAVAQSFDFSPFETIVDVGGGSGPLLFQILRVATRAKGVLFDLPEVIEKAEIPAELKARCRSVGGSFFETMPSGGDAYLLKSILHDWDDETCLKILSVCRRTLSPAARLIVVDQVIPAGNGPFFGKLADLHMHVLLGGKERTEEEFRELLRRGGFRLDSVVPTTYLLSVLQASPRSV